MNLFYLPKANLDVTSSKLCNGQLKQVVFSQYTEVIYGILRLASCRKRQGDRNVWRQNDRPIQQVFVSIIFPSHQTLNYDYKHDLVLDQPNDRYAF